MSLPPLPTVSASSLSTLTPPTTKIKFEEDLETWRTTSGYNHLVLFVRRLSEAVVGHDLPTPDAPFSSSEVCSLYKV
jgi:serine/threonine-protein phosphatase 2A activator